MTFGLPSWLKSNHNNLSYEIPIWYPSHDQPDWREWLVTNGRGGYASGTISGAHTRRYHADLVAALHEPLDRHIVLSKVDELVVLDNKTYELASHHWASGVVAPTGYKLLESFTVFPAPTWVYNLNGHYLVKQLTMPWGANEMHLGYYWLPDSDALPKTATIRVRFLVGFREFNAETQGSADKPYPQTISDGSTIISLDGSNSLHLGWNRGQYASEEQWWWGFHWPEETGRGMPDEEDLFLVGSLNANLDRAQELSLSASLNQPAEASSCRAAVEANLTRQISLIAKAALPRSLETNLLVLACDQFLVTRDVEGTAGKSVIAGYPWLNDYGRDAMIALPGLTCAVRRFDEGKAILDTFGKLEKNGLLPGFYPDTGDSPEFTSADASLWWAWALYQNYLVTKDLEFVRTQFPVLIEIAKNYMLGTARGIMMDSNDGLLRLDGGAHGLTWMDTRVTDIPITPRSGKPVEICALWYNLLRVLCFFGKELGHDVASYQEVADLAEKSMQKFWNNESQCLYDVIEPRNRPDDKPDDSVRPNQIFAVSMPFRALTKLQEKAILTAIDRELITPLGLRSLSPTHPSYQGRYGCGLAHADQYHRDISYHQGTVWPWLMGAYCDALLNVNGALPETRSKIRILLQPLLNHLIEEGCVGSISEIFDGNPPHIPHSIFAKAWSVAETMRTLAAVLKA